MIRVTPADRSLSPEASDLVRVQRIAARFVGCGILVYALIMVPTMSRQAGLTETWWVPLSVVLVVLPAVGVVVASFREGNAWVLPWASMSVCAYWIAVVTWFIAWRGGVPSPTPQYAVWLVQFSGLPGLLLVLARRWWWAIGNTLAATIVVHVADQLGAFGEVRTDVYLNVLFTLGLTGVFIAVGMVAVRTAVRLDESRAAVLVGASASAAAVAAADERDRFGALIHDHVLAVLLAVTPGAPDTRVIEQASAALAELDSREAVPTAPSTSGVHAAELIERLRRMADIADVTSTFEIDTTATDRAEVYPDEVATAVVEAAGEALRNVRRHAGADARGEIIGRFATRALQVCICDNGTGFDLTAVAPERLGVALGIRRRMAVLDGGSAEIHSAPGHGTEVMLRWSRA